MNTVLSFLTLSKTSVSFCPLFFNFAVPSSKSTHIELPRKRGSQNTGLRCKCSIWPGGPGSGDSDSSNRSVLDAFFLGKAVAEALNERIESTVGEILSTVGRLQAEQQKQVQDFQEEVLERAKKSKEKSARQAMEAQGLISKSGVETKVLYSITSDTLNSSTNPVTSVQSTVASETISELAKGEEPTTSSTSDE
ncbi:hypothetical protein GLYMA_18G149300v4 [Glycine max]|uniref:Uncharacterized protein n=1 Tax=Glycine max TaxID=3847 RepID=K7MSD5_SOYBN|nr:uncharacterized protein At4g13200, chloroplastic isoform X1 [Glycine max]KAH1154604.1 hypothetical protein GYH30_050046 [Glycine max]KRG99490.1 hypothetical protein GLYMA_18G149300v4 [Glycine max]|eukprot:XP_003552081.1 uncharacterized protein At4g13200, chloroplastic isoform X1 [Glycine max]